MFSHFLHRKQFLPVTPEEAWNFFSDPSKLQEITPAYMHFRITSGKPERMFAGQIITYTVRPVLGIPLFWMTEITHVKEGEYFIDEQRMGPYAFWHHRHLFRKVPGGVLMEDQVHYRLPFFILGELAHILFVKRQLNAIFNYRFRFLEAHFGRNTDGLT